MVAVTPCALSVSKQGEKEENDFCTGGVTSSDLVECCTFLMPGGALVYIGARNISALLWRDRGADVENRRMVFRFPSSFNAHTIPCAMPVFCRCFFTIYCTFLYISKGSFCFLYCRQSQVVTRYPFCRGEVLVFHKSLSGIIISNNGHNTSR